MRVPSAVSFFLKRSFSQIKGDFFSGEDPEAQDSSQVRVRGKKNNSSRSLRDPQRGKTAILNLTAAFKIKLGLRVYDKT